MYSVLAVDNVSKKTLLVPAALTVMADPESLDRGCQILDSKAKIDLVISSKGWISYSGSAMEVQMELGRKISIQVKIQ